MGRRPSPDGWGCSQVLSHSGSGGWAVLSPDEEGPAPWAPRLSLLASAQALAGLPLCRLESASPFPVVGPGLRGGVSSSSHSTPCLPHIYKCLVQPSKSRPENGPRGVSGQPAPPQGQRCHTGWMPADSAHQACRISPPTCCFCP